MVQLADATPDLNCRIYLRTKSAAKMVHRRGRSVSVIGCNRYAEQAFTSLLRWVPVAALRYARHAVQNRRAGLIPAVLAEALTKTG